ncbi:MAG: UDP-N-acetylmuramate--L-alanine ligase, partial [Deltaproteobacteria bacterium]
KRSAITDRLEKLGGIIRLEHKAAWIQGADVVVISSAVKEDNAEVQAARQEMIPVIRRAEMLAELMRMKSYGIAVAGSHGKTSTTSMVGWVLWQAGFDPTVVIGGQVNNFGSNAQLGKGEFLVAEADESDGSFLHLSPVLEVVTNIDLEHMDYYRDLDQIKDVFVQFINKIPFYGAAVLCLEDANLMQILPQIKKRVITYGLTSQAEVYAREVVGEGLFTSFKVYRKDELLGEVSRSLAGRHNVLNALAAITVGLELEIPFAIVSAALNSFTGVQRRMQIKGEIQAITVVDDYGHHPTEIRATLASMRAAWPARRLVVLFQPHRYSRTQALFKEFCTAFHEADCLFLTDIYPASEQPIEGVTAEALAEGIKQHGHRNVLLERDISGLPETVFKLLQEKDVVLTLGAGNIVQAGEQLLRLLEGAKV